jgi:hypothetical protein
VFEGIPLGADDVADKAQGLTADRLRAVIDLPVTVTVRPVGRGGHVFNPQRVQMDWAT